MRSIPLRKTEYLTRSHNSTERRSCGPFLPDSTFFPSPEANCLVPCTHSNGDWGRISGWKEIAHGLGARERGLSGQSAAANTDLKDCRLAGPRMARYDSTRLAGVEQLWDDWSFRVERRIPGRLREVMVLWN